MSALPYEYNAMDGAGTRRRGVVQAATQAEAFRKVSALGLTPVQIRVKGATGLGAAMGGGSRGKRIRVKDLSHFTYQMGVLVAARIPISEGLLSVAEQEKAGRLKDIILDLARRIESGQQVAQAMDEHRDALGPVYVETVRAAEKSGNLSKVLEHLSEMLERTQENIRQVRSALMYPICIVSVLGLAVFFLVGFVVPRFAKMFRQKGADLPMFTQYLMAFGESMRSYWWAYLLVIGGLVFAIRKAWATDRGRAAIDTALHRVPYLRQILIGLALSRFSRVFGLSLASGLGLIESLELAGRSAGRPLLSRDVERMAAQVRSGGRLTEVMKDCEYVTPFAKRMFTAGEQSAELSKMCSVVARHYERETTHLTKNLGTVIEPVLIVLIAMVVLVVALAIFLPMWDMVKLVG